MPVVVVIIIVAAWAVLLGPSLVKRRARGDGNQSITHFHYQLRVLEQRAPDPIVSPAYRLRSVDDSGAPTTINYPDTGKPPVLTVVGAKELPRPALAFLGEPEAEVLAPTPFDQRQMVPATDTDYDYDDYGYDPTPTTTAVPVATRAPDAYTRGQARRRRRDTLSVLGAVFVVTLLAALVTGSSFVWAIVALDAVALGAYVALLVHLRRMALEREMKLHYLDPLTARPSRPGAQRTYMSGRYAHPSNQQAAAR